jgi:hypothetical protein
MVRTTHMEGNSIPERPPSAGESEAKGAQCAFESELVRLAHSLRPANRPLASMLEVACELGVAVCLRLHTGTDPSFAQIDLGSRPPKVTIYRAANISGEREITRWDENLLTSRERFSLAHELGHWVAYSRLRIGPQTDRKLYWDHERAINAFAGCLLAPDWLAAKWLAEIPEGTPIPPFAVRYWATSQCRSSEEVVAKALARHRASIGFLKLLRTTKRGDGSQVLQVLCSVSGKALPLPRERSHIDSPELFGLLRSKQAGSAWVPRLRLGTCELRSLRLSWRRGSPIKFQESFWLSAALSTSLIAADSSTAPPLLRSA